jgi:hypothetical protein
MIVRSNLEIFGWHDDKQVELWGGTRALKTLAAILHQASRLRHINRAFPIISRALVRFAEQCGNHADHRTC